MHPRIGLEEADVGDDRVVQLDGDVVLGAQLVLGDSRQLRQADLDESGRSGIGQRRAVDGGPLRREQIARHRVPGIQSDGEPVVRSDTGRLRQEARLLLRLANLFQLRGALVDFRL